MEKFDLFRDLAERTGGDVYLGVVGPVRTGKSTFIKRFMELMVLPLMEDQNSRDRTRDELPQSGAGRTIMTTEPKFVPDEAQRIQLEDNLEVRIRLVDCVGYTVDGALGYLEGEGPRMVVTPWFPEPIPFQRAAEAGTRKVISEHSTVGLVVTTDGTITDLPRSAYVEAEERVIRELEELGKPYLILLNSTRPHSEQAQDLAQELSARYGVTVIPVDVMTLGQRDILGILGELLYEFPVREIRVRSPRWLECLPKEHPFRQQFLEAVQTTVEKIHKLRDVETAVLALSSYDFLQSASLDNMELGTGTATIALTAKRELFFRTLSELTQLEVADDHDLFQLMQELSQVKRHYDKIAEALAQVEERGYGIVTPQLDDIVFNEPEVIRQGGRFGVRLEASAPSIHMIRADIKTEVTPFVGTEKQGEEFVRRLTEEFELDPARIWQTDFLGMSLYDLIRDGLSSKLYRMPENAQEKLRETLTKIINEGSGGLICIIL
jgi:stage IV sporulation protein A